MDETDELDARRQRAARRALIFLAVVLVLTAVGVALALAGPSQEEELDEELDAALRDAVPVVDDETADDETAEDETETAEVSA